MNEAEQAFAVVRIDRFQPDEELRTTVKEVVWSLEEAEQEVALALNTLSSAFVARRLATAVLPDPGAPVRISRLF